ncbi:MAG: ABC transporter permease [Bacteroidaceae bacterium]|nr:ABC transporter permease [Bacteroidaceae bacterium]
MKEFFKNLGRYKLSSVLNILGLGLAFAAAYAILVQVNYDLGFNRSLKDSERVFRVETATFSEMYRGKMSDNICDPLGQSFGEDTTMVEVFGRMRFGTSPINLKLQLNGEEHTVEVMESWGTAGAPETVGFNLIGGGFDRLSTPNSILMSESLAENYDLELDDVVQDIKGRSLTIVGIFEDFPKNCDLHGLQMYISISQDELDRPNNWNYAYFYKLKEAWMKDAFLESLYPKLYDLNQMLDKMYYEYIGKEYPDTMTLAKFRSTPSSRMQLTSLKDIHFAKVETSGRNKTADATTTYTLLAIGIVILLIAFVNFINFFMAMVPRRIRRVNTEKIYGCTASRLRLGFVGEAVGLVLLGLLLATYIIFMIAPEVSASSFISTSIALEENWDMVLMMLGLGVVLAVIASIYPAYYITSVPPAFAIKGSFGNTQKGRRLRSALLSLQFFIALTLITCTLFIKLQHSYLMNYDTGFDKEQLLSVELDRRTRHLTDDANRPTFVSLLEENPMIKDITFSTSRMVAEERTTWSRPVFGEEDSDRTVKMDIQIVTPNFLEVMGIEITEGRNFEPRDMQNPRGAIIYTEAARHMYNLTLDTRIGWNTKEPSEVVGFCEDVKMQPLQYATKPTAFYVIGRDFYYSQLYIRTTEGADFEAVKTYIEECILKLAPKAKPEDIKVEFFDEQLGREYEKEKELTRLVTVFSLISILIALMGVFGLVFFETQYRRREIAVRRVHGAQISQVLGMFVGQYVKMVLVAFLFAAPVSYLIMSRWLEGFAYHIPLYWWVFFIALAIVLAVTSAIVVARAYRAAKEDPVGALYKE